MRQKKMQKLTKLCYYGVGLEKERVRPAGDFCEVYMTRSREGASPLRVQDILKLSQIVARLLRNQVGRDYQNYTKNLKILYLADREALRKWARPISGDSYAAMPKGPVLSFMYNLIMGRATPSAQAIWDQFVSTDGFNLVLKKDPGESELSPRECKLLDAVQERFKDYSYGKMIDFVHVKKNVPEYTEPPGQTSIPISLDAILGELGKDHETIGSIKRELQYEKYVSELLEG
jgi:uncharacterized phage-associated protein